MKIAIFGAGVMGRGIAHACVQAEIEVVLFDHFLAQPAFMMYAKNELRKSLFFARKSDGSLFFKSNHALETVLTKITWHDTSECETDNSVLKECDTIIEAIIENIEEKKKLYQKIEVACASIETTPRLFSNTSTIQIKRLAKHLDAPQRFMGLHFFNPVPDMKLVEAIPHEKTDTATIESATTLAERLGKKLFLVPDVPAFVVNRLLMPMITAFVQELEKSGMQHEAIDKAFTTGTWPEHDEAMRVVQAMIDSAERLVVSDQHKSSIQISQETIDELMRLGAKVPLGPFGLKKALHTGATKDLLFKMGPARLADLVGIDIILDCCEMLSVQEPKRWPVPKLLKTMLQNGKKGMKSGSGFYSYMHSVKTAKIDAGCVEISWEGKYLSRLIIRELINAFRNVDTTDTNAIVLKIRRCRGADVAEFPAGFFNPLFVREIITDWHALIKCMAAFPAPIVALVYGSAIGGGYELALASDYIIAEEKSTIGLPETKLGILPGGGGTQNLPRRVGMEKALWMILGGETIKAAIPWVDRTVPRIEDAAVIHEITSNVIKKKNRPPVSEINLSSMDAVIHERIHEWKKRGTRPPDSFLLASSAIYAGNKKELNEGLVDELGAITAAFQQPTAEEGIRAFFEQREPHF